MPGKAKGLTVTYIFEVYAGCYGNSEGIHGQSHGDAENGK
jgi:hypothetical protein